MKLENELRDFLNKHEMTVEDLATIMGKTRRTIHNWLMTPELMPMSAKLVIRSINKGDMKIDWVAKQLVSQ
jgi:predicted transcriptional regulator